MYDCGCADTGVKQIVLPGKWVESKHHLLHDVAF